MDDEKEKREDLILKIVVTSYLLIPLAACCLMILSPVLSEPDVPLFLLPFIMSFGCVGLIMIVFVLKKLVWAEESG